MRTVKEMAKLTGISARTLHYYDEIGLLRPTEKSGAGYRLYDDRALEDLQQILFFREFDIPLKEIRSVMEDPAFDRDRILRMQRKMLTAKKERLERLIASIDDILKGENKMDFAVFSKTEIEELFRAMTEHMPEELKKTAAGEFGGMEEWKAHYMAVVSSGEMQKRYAKMVEWYGGKDAYLSAVKNPVSKEVAASYSRRMDAVLQKLMERRDCALDSFEVKEVIGEYAFVLKQACQLKDEKGMMLALAASYRKEKIRSLTDEKYGDGAAEFFARAIETFYK